MLVPADLIVTVGISRQHGLAESVVVCLEENHHLGLEPLQILRVQPEHRALAIDGVYDGPRQRQEQDLLAFQFELAILPGRLPVFLFDGHQQYAGLNLHEVVAPPVDHAKLQALDVLIRRHQHLLAEADLCRWA